MRTLKIIINLIKHKNAYKQTKTKKGSVFIRIKTSKEKKVSYSLICVFVLFVLFVLLVLFVPFVLFVLFAPFVLLVLFVLFVRAKSFHKKEK